MSKPTLNDILATNLARLMEKTGHKQASLAKLSGVGQTTVSLYLNPSRRQPSKSGKVPSAKFGEVEALAAALGVAPWDLLQPHDEAVPQGAVSASQSSPARGGLFVGEGSEDAFPMKVLDDLAPWEGGKTVRQMEREEAPQVRLSRAPDVGHVPDSGYSANDHKFLKVPELDVRLAAGRLGIENYQETEIGEIQLRKSFLESFGLPVERMKIVYADGDSMEPVIRHRSPMLFYEEMLTSKRQLDPRTVYAINLDGKMVVKCIVKGKNGAWFARSLNPAYEDFPLSPDDGGEIRIVGRILWSPYDLRNGVDERLIAR